MSDEDMELFMRCLSQFVDTDTVRKETKSNKVVTTLNNGKIIGYDLVDNQYFEVQS